MDLHFSERSPAASSSVAGPAANTTLSIAVRIATCSIRSNTGQKCRPLAGISHYNLARQLSSCGPPRPFNVCAELDFDFFEV